MPTSGLPMHLHTPPLQSTYTHRYTIHMNMNALSPPYILTHTHTHKKEQQTITKIISFWSPRTISRSGGRSLGRMWSCYLLQNTGHHHKEAYFRLSVSEMIHPLARHSVPTVGGAPATQPSPWEAKADMKSSRWHTNWKQVNLDLKIWEGGLQRRLISKGALMCLNWEMVQPRVDVYGTFLGTVKRAGD